MEIEITNRVEMVEKLLKNTTRRFDALGYIKLFAILILGLIFVFLRNYPIPLIIVGLVVLAINIFLWYFHYKIHQSLTMMSNTIAINKRHLYRISGKWVEFPDIGAEFINHEHQYSSDLDIVGKKSLFQFLNTTHTWYGRQAFVNDLLQPKYTKKTLLLRQQAIKELSKDMDFLNQMEHSFSKIGLHKSMENLVKELKDTQMFIKNRMLKRVLMYMPLVILSFAVGVFLLNLESMYIPAVTLIAMQALVWISGIIQTKRYLAGISRLPYKLNVYCEVIELIKGKNLESEILQRVQAQLGTSQVSAQQAIKELNKIADMVSFQYNPIIWAVLNVAFLWDIGCSIRFEQWKIKYAHLAEGWFLALGEMESLLCFSMLPNVCNNISLPSVTKERKIIAQNLGHPLIPNNIRVNNDITSIDDIFIISGSNMSGKTTFMRTVGINLVLACAGSFVCAKTMTFPLVEVITSMRIADDLNEGISTFYAELKRIKRIISLAEKNPHMIFLIDEIFRGTNSVDRLSGARAVLNKLNNMGVLGIITTHDLELCDITIKLKRIKNYSFSEKYHNNQIHFDYKLKQGKSTTTNANFLMKMVGIS